MSTQLAKHDPFAFSLDNLGNGGDFNSTAPMDLDTYSSLADAQLLKLIPRLAFTKDGLQCKQGDETIALPVGSPSGMQLLIVAVYASRVLFARKGDDSTGKRPLCSTGNISAREIRDASGRFLVGTTYPTPVPANLEEFTPGDTVAFSCNTCWYKERGSGRKHDPKVDSDRAACAESRTYVVIPILPVLPLSGYLTKTKQPIPAGFKVNSSDMAFQLCPTWKSMLNPLGIGLLRANMNSSYKGIGELPVQMMARGFTKLPQVGWEIKCGIKSIGEAQFGFMESNVVGMVPRAVADGVSELWSEMRDHVFRALKSEDAESHEDTSFPSGETPVGGSGDASDNTGFGG